MLNDEIIRLINEGVKDQNELLNSLKELGFELTQSSISRKLKQMGIIKSQGKYQLLSAHRVPVAENQVISVPPNLLVVKTKPGHANVVAAVIDEKLIASNSNFVATIAGDDTVFIAINSQVESIDMLVKKVKSVI